MVNTFKINGVAFSRQPTSHRWINQSPFGITGDGHMSYSAFREYELEFDFASASEFSDFNNYFQSIGVTGTAAVDLPDYATPTYVFRTFSGVIVSQPEYGDFFENFYQSAKLTISRIRIA